MFEGPGQKFMEWRHSQKISRSEAAKEMSEDFPYYSFPRLVDSIRQFEENCRAQTDAFENIAPENLIFFLYLNAINPDACILESVPNHLRYYPLPENKAYLSQLTAVKEHVTAFDNNWGLEKQLDFLTATDFGQPSYTAEFDHKKRLHKFNEGSTAFGGIYVFYDGAIEYIGIAFDFHMRFMNHFKKHQNHKVLCIYIDFPRYVLEGMERVFIERINPPLNLAKKSKLY